MSKGNNTRSAIIEKSAVLFNKKGYDGCSMQDIMKETGLKKGGIYNHFDTKTELALEAFNYGFDKVMARFRARLDKDSTSTQKLISVIDVLTTFVSDPVLEGGCPIFNMALKSTEEYPELKQKAREGIDMFRRYIEIKIEEGKATGEFNPSCNPSEVATFIIMTMEGGIILSNIYNGKMEHVLSAARLLKEYISEKLLKI